MPRSLVAIIATLCCLLWGSAYPSIKIGYILFNINSSDIPSKLVFAGSAIYSKKLTKTMDVMVEIGYSLFFGGLILTLLGIFSGGRVYNFTMKSSLLLTYMGFLSAVAFTLWTLLLKYNKVSTISVFNFLIPIFGAVLSSIFLGENILEFKNIIALVLVCLGIWLANRETAHKSKAL